MNNNMIIQNHIIDIEDKENDLSISCTLTSYNFWLRTKPSAITFQTLDPNNFLNSKVYRNMLMGLYSKCNTSTVSLRLELEALKNEMYSIPDSQQLGQEMAVQCFKDCIEYNLPYTIYAAYIMSKTPTTARRWLIEAMVKGMITDVSPDNKYYKQAIK